MLIGIAFELNPCLFLAANFTYFHILFSIMLELIFATIRIIVPAPFDILFMFKLATIMLKVRLIIFNDYISL